MHGRLSELNSTQPARVSSLSAGGSLRRRLQDLGFVPGAPVRFLYGGFHGGIAAYAVGGAVIALRRCDSEKILVEI